MSDEKACEVIRQADFYGEHAEVYFYRLQEHPDFPSAQYELLYMEFEDGKPVEKSRIGIDSECSLAMARFILSEHDRRKSE